MKFLRHSPLRGPFQEIGAILLPSLIWLGTIAASASMVRFDHVPAPPLLFWPYSLCAAAVLAVFLSLHHARRIYQCRKKPDEYAMSPMAQRLGGLYVLTAVATFYSMRAPHIASNLMIYGGAAICAWALSSWHAEKSSQAPARWRRDTIYILLAATCLYWAGGVYYTTAVGEHAGDEGHYLIQAESLYHDGDLDLRNNFEARGITDGRQRVHISPFSRGDNWYSWHSPGLAFLLAPTVPGGIVWRHLVLGLIAGSGLAFMHALARIIGADRRSSLLVTVLLGSGAYWAIYASRALPEMLGATLTVLALCSVFEQRRRPWLSLVLCALCIGFLPWAQARFIPVAATLWGAYGLHGLLGSSESWRQKILRMTLFTLLCSVLLGHYQYIQHQMFEGGLALSTGLLFSHTPGMWHTLASNRGILYMLPLFACALAACVRLAGQRHTRFFALYAGLLFLSVFLTSCATVWFTAGSTLPGRFLLVIIPVLMAGLARALGSVNAGFRILTCFTGCVPIAFLLAQLTVLERFGRSFPNLYLIEQTHPFFTGLFRFYYDPYQTWSLWPALALYLAAGVLLLRPAISRIGQVLTLVLLMAVYAGFAHAPGTDATPDYGTTAWHQQISQVARVLDHRPIEHALILGPGPRSRELTGSQQDMPRSFFNYSNRFAHTRPGKIKSVTSKDLGEPVDGIWISLPYLYENDWEDRPYRWATLVTPFLTGTGLRAFYIEARLEGDTGAVIAIREGRITHHVKTYPPGATIADVFRFKASNKGDIYLLVRFTGEKHGTFTTERIAYTAIIDDLQRATGLTLEAPAKQDDALNYNTF